MKSYNKNFVINQFNIFIHKLSFNLVLHQLSVNNHKKMYNNILNNISQMKI
jgi:hypothetical protein